MPEPRIAFQYSELRVVSKLHNAGVRVLHYVHHDANLIPYKAARLAQKCQVHDNCSPFTNCDNSLTFTKLMYKHYSFRHNKRRMQPCQNVLIVMSIILERLRNALNVKNYYHPQKHHSALA